MGIYSTAILAETALQSYWQLNEASGNVSDSKGALTGTAAGTLTYAQTGYGFLGNSIKGDGGSTTKITFGDNYRFSGTSSFTIEAWVNRGTDTDGRFISKYDENLGNGWNIAVSGSKLYVIRHDGTNANDVTGATTLSASTWYHLAVTYDGTHIRLYVNGVLDATSSTTNANITSPTTKPFTLYTSADTGFTSATYTFAGTLQHVAVYNAALAAASLLAHYQAGGGLASTETGAGTETSAISGNGPGTSTDSGTGTDATSSMFVTLQPSGGGGVLAADDFTGAAGRLSAHTPTGTGAAGTWSDDGNAQHNRLTGTGDIYCSGTSGAQTAHRTYHSQSVTDGAVSVDCIVQASGTGYVELGSRSDGTTSNFYQAVFDCGGNVGAGKVQLYKNVAGVQTLLGSYDSGSAWSGTHSFKLETIGTAIKVYVDGAAVVSVTDSALASGTPSLSINTSNALSTSVGVHADNFSVTSGSTITLADTATGTETSSVSNSTTFVSKTPGAPVPGSFLTRTTSGSVVFASTGGGGDNNYPQGGVMANGDIRAWFQNRAQANVGTTLSTDGGATFGSFTAFSPLASVLSGTQFSILGGVRRGHSGRYHMAIGRAQWYADGTYGGVPAGPISDSQVNYPTAVGNLIVYEPFYCYSDDGTTWSTPEAVAYTGANAAPMDVTELANGEVLLSWYGNGAASSPPYTSTGDYPDTKVSRRDGSGNWNVVGTMASKTGMGGYAVVEPAVDVILDGSTYGKIIGSFHIENGTPSSIYTTISTNGGATWSTPALVTTGVNRNGLCVGPDGDVILTSQDGSKPVFRVSQDSGSTWSSPTSLTTSGGNFWTTPFPIGAAGVSPNVGVLWGTGTSDPVGDSYFRALTRGGTPGTPGLNNDVGSGSEGISHVLITNTPVSATQTGTGTETSSVSITSTVVSVSATDAALAGESSAVQATVLFVSVSASQTGAFTEASFLAGNAPAAAYTLRNTTAAFIDNTTTGDFIDNTTTGDVLDRSLIPT